MRAFQDTITPLIVIGVANVLSIGMSALLIVGFGMGIEGSAIANVIAQAASGLVFLELLRRTGAPLRPSWARMRTQFAAARDLSVRTLAFFAAFTIATGVAARMGDAQLAAQQIGVQLWTFCALFLDATAIAAQALIGRLLGSSALSVAARAGPQADGGRGDPGRWLRRWCSGLGHSLIPRIFTSDPAVLHQAAVLWPWLAGMMPMAGVLFALDGVFFGAGDLRFMRNVTVVGAFAGVRAADAPGLGARPRPGRHLGRPDRVCGDPPGGRAGQVAARAGGWSPGLRPPTNKVTETATIHTSITPEVALSTVVPGMGALTSASGTSAGRQPGDEPRQRIAGGRPDRR